MQRCRHYLAAHIYSAARAQMKAVSLSPMAAKHPVMSGESSS